jgi:hypothetical protein
MTHIRIGNLQRISSPPVDLSRSCCPEDITATMVIVSKNVPHPKELEKLPKQDVTRG